VKLNPNLIPHSEFHKGLWLQTEKSPWYFFYKTPREYPIPTGDSFYETVDENLLDLVKFLHSKNIPTTPSCSGHVKPIMEYATLFNTIKNVQNSIKSDGVNFVNPETNRKFFYKNPKYRLPWDKEEFLSEMGEYQKRGVLGFVDSNLNHEWISKKIPCTHDNGITLILTKSDNEDKLKRTWKSITQIIKENLHK